MALVSSAINKLKSDKRTISLANIRETAMTMPGGRRLSESTITRNKDVHALYLAATGTRPTHRTASSQWLLSKLPDDQKASAKKTITKLKRRSKTELVFLVLENVRRIGVLEDQLKTIRAAKLDAILPSNLRVLRPIPRN